MYEPRIPADQAAERRAGFRGAVAALLGPVTVTADGPLPSTPYDVAIVGAGVVGCAIARELARHPRLRIAWSRPRTTSARAPPRPTPRSCTPVSTRPPAPWRPAWSARATARLGAYAAEAGIPVERVGALLVAWDEEQLAALPRLAEKAERNAYPDTALLGPAELYAREPHPGPGALGALHIPGESIICPWTTTLAYATPGGPRRRRPAPEHRRARGRRGRTGTG